ncbi:MAG: TIGR04255 family protein [Candidatus Peregrinibacteria bacterium]|nr:TIGR04255 family protein [Candidatus Peregrinibacteria bacterium]
MKIPKEISPCPIIEAVIEIRFESTFPSEAVFGILYQEYRATYPEIEKLPILQLPEQIRDSDENLKYQPHYKILSDKFIFQIGPRVISLGCRIENEKQSYIGWAKFSAQIYAILDKLTDLKVISEYKRLGIRYINHFNLDIFAKSTLKIETPMVRDGTVVGFETNEDIFTSRVQITNKGTLTIGGKTKKIGSLIDVDTSTMKLKDCKLNEIKKYIEKGRNVEKKLFFELLKDDYTQTLKPKYV